VPAPAFDDEEDIVFDEEEVLELTEPLEPEPAPQPEPEPEPEYVPEPVAAQPARYEPEPEPYIEPEEDIAFEEPVMSAQSTYGSSAPAAPSLLSNDAATAASAAFGALASSMLTSAGGSKTLEDLVADMLKPMLKQWLDQNLPGLVEQLVREEIERVARRPR
jgi:cell pole-organizing protein PopZ